MASNIPETDITRNWEQSSLNRLFPCTKKVFTPEDVTERLENMEALLRIILDRLSDVDGKRIQDELAPFGYNLTVVNKH